MPRHQNSSVEYDKASIIQAKSFDEILQKIPEYLQPRAILDLGCGTGIRTNELSLKFPKSKIIGIDPLSEKIEYASCKYPHIKFYASTVMEFNEKAFDLIISNASLQWMRPLDDNLRKIQSLLAPDGYFIGAVFGPDTFKELQCVLEHCKKHVKNPAIYFPNPKTLLDNGINYFEWRMERVIFKNKFETLKALLQSIQRTGTGGQHGAGLWTPRFLNEAEIIYRQLFGGIYATYDIMLVTGKRKP